MRFVLRLGLGLLSLAAILTGLWHLSAATAGLSVTEAAVGPIPVTVFRPAEAQPAPVVVIAHGFAGSQQLMLPFATSLARNGYVAVTFDFPGHGRNPTPLAGGLTNDAAASGALLGAVAQVAAFAQGLGAQGLGDGRVALLGHSMASDIVVRHAQAHPATAATIAVSVFSPGVTPDSPRNLLVIVGALEPAMLRDEGLRIAGQAAGGAAVPGVTYGDIAAGTARRVAFAGGVEHIAVLYSPDSMAEAVAWLNQVFDRHGSGWLDARGPWLGLVFGGLVVLAWPLSGFLPRVVAGPASAALGWKRLWPIAVLPAIVTPLLLWRMPTDFLPLLLGDYLAVHFAVYGGLTAIGLWWRGAGLVRPRWGAFLAAVALVAGYGVFAFGWPIDAFVTSVAPVGVRLPLVLAMLAGTLPYFLADEWLTRGTRGAYAVTKICFLLSLAIAIALSLERLFFLIIILPVILIFFTIYGLFSNWSHRATGHPWVGGVANAATLAMAIAATFPMVAR